MGVEITLFALKARTVGMDILELPRDGAGECSPTRVLKRDAGPVWVTLELPFTSIVLYVRDTSMAGDEEDISFGSA